MSLISLESFFMVFDFEKMLFTLLWYFPISSFELNIDYHIPQMLPSNLLVTPTWVTSIFLLKTTYCCFMWFTIFYVKVVRKRPWRDFLINRFNLLIFNTIFTSNLTRVLTSSSLWEFILVRLQAFLWFYWEWAPTRVFLYHCFDVQNYLFSRTPLGGCSHFFYFQEVFF